VFEYWSIGVLEHWSVAYETGKILLTPFFLFHFPLLHYSMVSLLHHSITPLLHGFNTPLLTKEGSLDELRYDRDHH